FVYYLQLVRSMGGVITVNSAPGSGSEFQFTIPQKVLDETPIVSIKDKKHLFAAYYVNMEKYEYTLVREGYENCIHHMVNQFGIPFRICRNLEELKRRIERENYSHIFIGWEEYREDRSFFDELSTKRTVVLILDYDQEILVQGNMLRIYKPFTILSIAAVFNGQKLLVNEEQHISLHNKFIAPQAKVLVVDDNAMNLKVMARLLLPYQLKVIMASGGQEALEKLNTPDFDCVFLDHMMPEMDGVETLHKIRQKPGLYYQSLPIIAFTANAIGGAREMFMAEGFNDFIAKPIELSVLERILRRYIPTQLQIIVDEDEAAPASEADQTPAPLPQSSAPAASDTAVSADKSDISKAKLKLTRAGISLEQAIAYCGDEEGFKEIIAIFHSEGQKRRDHLSHFFKEQDWKNYVISVHALKGNAKAVGAGELSEMARELEMAGKENRIDYILAHHEAMMENHDSLLTALDNNIFIYPNAAGKEEAASSKDITEPQDQNAAPQDETASAEAADNDGSTLETLLEQIDEKLSAFESEGLSELLDRLESIPGQSETFVSSIKQIRDLAADFDFLSATEVLERMEK
ncbi:MAG: response regulator, partial [Lachnospiraceae bacterium]|nr:response regulator [Lachnospiraceae bacterium]